MTWIYYFYTWLLPTAAADDAGVNLLQPLPNHVEPITSLPDYLKIIFPLFIGLAAVLSILQFAHGGLLYMMSEAFTDKGRAKGLMKDSVWGLVLALAAWLIIHEINPTILDTTNLFPN